MIARGTTAKMEDSALRTMGPQLALTFDVDGFSNWIGSLGATSPGLLSRGEFEHVGLGRVLTLLREYGIRATFFVPGSTAASFPGPIREIVDAGHEIGHHGWVHEPLGSLTEARERAVLIRGIEELGRVTGVQPAGYRAPGWDLNQRTVELLLEHGFEYDSSLMGNDYSPYWCRVGDLATIEEGFTWGRPVQLIELPVAWHLDDHPQFEHIETAGVSNMGLRSPVPVMDIWIDELTYLRESVHEGVMVLTLHPQVIGRGHRVMMLRKFLDRVVQWGDVGFTTCLDYARDWRIGRNPSLPLAAAGAPGAVES